MGDMADDARDSELLWESSIESAWDEGFWVTNDGDLIRVTEMKDSHLDNTIRMLESGRASNRAFCLYGLKEEQKRRKAVSA